MKPRFIYLVIVSSLLWTCKKLPMPSERQFTMDVDISWENDSLTINLVNPVKCPLRIRIYHLEPAVDSLLPETFTFVLEDLEEKTLAIPMSDWSDEKEKGLKFSASLGSPAHLSLDSTTRYALPFPEGKAYQVVQGYNGSYSHQSDYSRYAIDFDLQQGDTICAARDGVVVGVIKGYNIGGSKQKYRPYANYLSIYHEDGVITQYVHLLQNGTLVELGDTVRKGQPIGLSGLTGYTGSPHLHFNVLKPTESSTISMPVIFTTGPGADLKRGIQVRN